MKRFMAPLLAALAMPAAAQDAPEPATPASVVAEAPASDWRTIDAADLLVMTLAPDRDGSARRVVIQLLPAPFSQGWVRNVRALAKAHWWDGTSVYRVVDNWVAQWGDADEAKPLPAGVQDVPESEFTAPMNCEVYLFEGNAIGEKCEPEFIELAGVDPYLLSGQTGFSAGWPVGFKLESGGNRIWPTHCYGTVGVARDTGSTGSGSELYAVIGHAPRQLDRNIAVVGRVIEGIEHLSTLPRGKGDAGVYDDAAVRMPIVSVRLGNEVGELPRFEFLASDSESFKRYVEVRASRKDGFYKVPAGGIDVCNVQVPIRRVADE